jgi:hypothetical protein
LGGTRSVGPGGWWSWPVAVFVAALAPLAALSGLSLLGLRPLTVWGALCLLLLIVIWWDELSPRIAWNAGGFVARGPHGMHRGSWTDARSVFVLGLGGGRRGYREPTSEPGPSEADRYREPTSERGTSESKVKPGRYILVVVTPSGRFELVPTRFWWTERTSGRHLRAQAALEEIRTARAAAGPYVGVPPRLMPPLGQLIVVFLLWLAGLAIGVLVG